MVAQKADPPDEAVGSKVDRRPLTDTILTPPAIEGLDLLRGPVAVEGRHVGEEIRLGVDRGERLEVVRPPLAEEQARRS
jgi:hypothetical protein